MAITLAEFLLRFPEFNGTETDEPGLVQKKLTSAELYYDELAFGSTALYEEIVYYEAAAQLTDQPYGQPSGLTQDVNARERNRYRIHVEQKLLPLCLRRGQITGGGLT